MKKGYFEEDYNKQEKRPCEKCGKTKICEEIPLMGYSEWLCEKCAAVAYQKGK